MKINIKKFFLASFVLVAGIISFTPTAKAESFVSFSFSESRGGYHHVKRGHHYDRWERKAMRRHKREMRREHKRARRAARYHARWDSYRYWPYSSDFYSAVHYTPPVIYQSVTVLPAPTPIYYQPAPMLANQASASYLSKGQTCREYQSQAVINGRTQQTYGTACLQSDGAWRIVE